MNALALLAAGAVALTTVAGLPLRRGAYVDASGECRGASASRSWFEGAGYIIQHHHARCELKSVTRPGPRRYAVAKRCYEYGDRLKGYDVVDRIRIISEGEYQLDNRFGSFHARWCHD